MSVASTGSPMKWHMPPDIRAILLGRDGLKLAEWLCDGSATIVKDAPHRAVYRVKLPTLDCHVKQYRLLGLRSRLRELLRPLKAKREHAIASELRARGIATPDPIGWGSANAGVGPSPSWLVTTTVPDAIPLLSYIESLPPRSEPGRDSLIRERLAQKLGEFLAQLHAAGVIHRDLHPGNLLVHVGADGEPRIWLIDLHAVALGPACSWEMRQANLIVFNRYFQMRASRSDRARFWKAYAAAANGSIRRPVRLAATELERQTWESNLRFWQARDARCLRSNRYYQRIHGTRIRGFAVRDLDGQALATLVADPDAPFSAPGARVLKDSRSSTVVEFDIPSESGPLRVVFKRFRVTDRHDAWINMVRKSSAVRSWIFGHGLRERCLPTARPLAAFHRFQSGLPREGYLLTEKIENAIDLHEFVGRLAKASAEVGIKELRARMTVLAGLIRRLHERGLTHRDLKASNLLTVEVIGDTRFWFIDLVGVRRRRVTQQRKMRDLMRLDVSFRSNSLVTHADRLRFLLAYLHAGLHGAGGWKDCWRAIDAATKIKVAKNGRSGRPLG